MSKARVRHAPCSLPGCASGRGRQGRLCHSWGMRAESSCVANPGRPGGEFASSSTVAVRELDLRATQNSAQRRGLHQCVPAGARKRRERRAGLVAPAGSLAPAVAWPAVTELALDSGAGPMERGLQLGQCAPAGRARPASAALAEQHRPNRQGPDRSGRTAPRNGDYAVPTAQAGRGARRGGGQECGSRANCEKRCWRAIGTTEAPSAV